MVVNEKFEEIKKDGGGRLYKMHRQLWQGNELEISAEEKTSKNADTCKDSFLFFRDWFFEDTILICHSVLLCASLLQFLLSKNAQGSANYESDSLIINLCLFQRRSVLFC